MKKAYITVFFSICMAVSMALFIGLIYGARENAIRMRAKQCMDVAMTSTFGDYQKTLWDRYALVFVDAGYGHKADSMILTENRFQRCMNRNFDECPTAFMGGTDLLRLDCSAVETEAVRFATDCKGAAVRNQAVEYMKYHSNYEHIADIYAVVSHVNDSNFTGTSLKEYVDSSLDSLGPFKDSYEIKEWTDRLDGAVLTETDVSLLSTLRLVVNHADLLSKKMLNKDALIEKRELNQGNYPKINEPGAVGDLLFKEYLIEKCGNYLKPADDTALSYEAEYLISGRCGDTHNLEGVVNRLLLIREGSNFAAIYNDPSKMEIIRAITTMISCLLGEPELSEPLAMIVVAVWAYAESVKDVKVLMAGGKVPLVKNPNDFYTDVDQSSTG